MGLCRFTSTFRLAIPLVFLATIAPNGQAQSSSDRIVEDATDRLQDPIREPIRPASRPRIGSEFESAPALFRQGKFAEAEPQFAWIAQIRKGTTWGERSQYYLAECQFEQKKFAEALESLERLERDYPATDYAGQIVRREYEIAQRWITWTKPPILTSNKPVAIAPGKKDSALENTEKLALRALHDVRQHAPLSPQAVQASIKLAEYYMSKGDYTSAVAHYDVFITEYWKHPLAPRARLGAAEARARIFLSHHGDSPILKLACGLGSLFLIRFSH